MTVEPFDVDPELEMGLVQALSETPAGEPPPATVPLSGFLTGVLLAFAALVATHLLLGAFGLQGVPRYAIEAVVMIVVGWLVVRYLGQLAQEGRAVDANGNVVDRATLLGAYKERMFGTSFQDLSPAESVVGLPRELAGEGLLFVGRTDDHLVIYREEEDGHIDRLGLRLDELSAEGEVPGETTISLLVAGERLVLTGVHGDAVSGSLGLHPEPDGA